MTELGWWMVVSPFLVIFTGLRVMRHKNRYKGRHRAGVGVDIFRPPPAEHSNCRCTVIPSDDQLWWRGSPDELAKLTRTQTITQAEWDALGRMPYVVIDGDA
jgi:hypothetical protein